MGTVMKICVSIHFRGYVIFNHRLGDSHFGGNHMAADFRFFLAPEKSPPVSGINRVRHFSAKHDFDLNQPIFSKIVA